MDYIKNILTKIKHYLKRARKSRPENIPQKLDKETLEKAMREARFLFSQHAVDVHSLALGEVPGLPKLAQPEINAVDLLD